MKSILTVILVLIFINTVSSQHITNTLGTNGIFRIKDGSATIFSLSQSDAMADLTGNLKLANTNSGLKGIIYKGLLSFIHNFEGVGSLGGNTFVGLSAGNFTMTAADYNTGIGYRVLSDLTTGSRNTATGYISLSKTTTGTDNSAYGTGSLFFNSTGNLNSGFGTGTLYSNLTGYSNTAIGSNSLTNNTFGAGNTSIGSFSMTANTIGQLNTVIGYQAGSNIINGSNVTLLGYNSEPSSSSASNEITLGNNSVTSLRCNVTTITSLSDARDKKNIHDLDLGLDFISKLKPRIYNWDKREWYDNNISDGSKTQEIPTAGFIAQELDELQSTENAEWLNLVMKDNPEKWEATPGNLLPVMVRAIQELNTKCDALQQENDKLTTKLKEVNELKEKLAFLLLQIENLNSKTDELQRSSGNDNNRENNIQIISNENTK